MPLSPLHAKHCCSVLAPKYRHLSPVFGLISLNSSFLTSNLSSFPNHYAHTRALIHELFTCKEAAGGGRWTCTQSKSRAAFYLNTPQRLAHVLGLSLLPSSNLNGKERDVLYSLGIETNKVDGQRTGVSLQKYRDLVANLRAARERGEGMAIPLYSQFVWQRAANKTDIWTYFQTLQQHYVPDLFANGVRASEFVEDNFSPKEFTPALLERASLALAEEGKEEEDASFARDLELVAANLSTFTWKPVWKLIKHEIPTKGKGNAPPAAVVYDCVEVVVRELVDMLLFDEQSNSFRAAQSYELLADFYAKLPTRSEEESSRAWFALCQGVPQCEYIVDQRYELLPGLKNVLQCAAHLLGLKLEATITTGAFCQAFNQDRDAGERLEIQERREMFRPALAEESQRREIALCRLGSLCIELTLVPSHRLATAKHSRIAGSEWVVNSRAKHLAKYCESLSSSNASRLLAPCFWPAFLQEEMLLLLPNDAKDYVHRIASTPWGRDRERNWSLDQSFLTSEPTLQELAARRNATQRALLMALRLAVEKRDVELVIWLLNRQSETTVTMDFAIPALPLALALQSSKSKSGGDAIWEADARVREALVRISPQALDILQHNWQRVSLLDRARYYSNL